MRILNVAIAPLWGGGMSVRCTARLIVLYYGQTDAQAWCECAAVILPHAMMLVSCRTRYLKVMRVVFGVLRCQHPPNVTPNRNGGPQTATQLLTTYSTAAEWLTSAIWLNSETDGRPDSERWGVITGHNGHRCTPDFTQTQHEPAFNNRRL